MKGKLYKPFTTVGESRKENAQRFRPWANDTDQPKVYMWSSSIPEKWKEIKGAKGFQHVSQTGNNRNTLDFLKTNEKYINTIADPLSKAPSCQESSIPSRLSSRMNSRAASPTNIQRIRKLDKEIFLYNSETPFHPLESPSIQIHYPSIKPEQLKSVCSYSLPEPMKRHFSNSASLKNITLDIPENSKDEYLVNQYSLPKLLVPMKKNKSSKEIRFKNRTVDDFIKRFDKKDEMIAIVVPRKGINGWKLVNGKKQAKQSRC